MLFGRYRTVSQANFGLFHLRDEYSWNSRDHSCPGITLSRLRIELPGRDIEPAGEGHELSIWSNGLSERIIEGSKRINELSDRGKRFDGRINKLYGTFSTQFGTFSTLCGTLSTLFRNFPTLFRTFPALSRTFPTL